jgi:hypothetical protein
MNKVKYPDVEVQLTGQDGNVFGIIGRVSKAIGQKHGREAKLAFQEEATQQGSYDEVLALCMRTVEVY